MSEKAKILIIEDEEDIASFIETELSYEGYQIETASDGIQGLALARKINPDLIILDRMLPQMDGIELCKRIKQTSDIPVLMLTVMGTTADKVAGLDAGANDYLVKPFSLEELLARVRAQLRLRKPAEKQLFEFQDLSLNILTREVYRNNNPISLTPKEFDILSLLIQNPRNVLTREKLIEKVWGYDFEGETNVLEVIMHGLREKIEKSGLSKLIHTARGIGYSIKESK